MLEPKIIELKAICCPSCHASESWTVGFGPGLPIGANRIILDCKCEYRLSLPFYYNDMNTMAYCTMPLEYDLTRDLRN